MNSKGATIILLGAVAAISFSCPSTAVRAATRGEQSLQTLINAESGRVAALKALLDPKFGITHTIQKKSRGNDVKLLQQFLKTYGTYPEGLITGYFGPLTEAAAKGFQQKEGIDPVGIVGPITRARIVDVSARQSAAAAAAASAAPSSTSPAITAATLASDIAENGSAAGASGSFASTTPNLYAVLSLRNVPQDAQIGYIRYYQGSYVDSAVSHPSRSGLAYFHFQWSLKPGMNRIPGNYSLVFYLNGKSAKTVTYSIY